MIHATRMLTLLLVLFVATAAVAQPTEPEQPEPPQPQTEEVEQGAFTAEVRGNGRYTATRLAQVTVELDAYTGKLEVAEVLAEQGRVSRGQPVLRLTAPDLDEQLDNARRALERAERGLAWAQQEQAISKAEAEQAAEQRRLAWADRQSDHKAWQAFQKADQYLDAKLDMQQYEARVADEQEELNQLEKLYKDAKLASRTQDIVLERARRQLAVSLQRLEMAERSNNRVVEVIIPRRDRDEQNALRYVETQHKHAELRAKITREKQDQSVESATRAVEDAREALADLQADQQSLTLEAPAGGVLVPIDLKPGDTVSNRQAIATLDDDTAGELKMTIQARDLRVLAEGAEVTVRWHAFGEVETAGTVERIDWQGQAAGERGAQYGVTITLDEVDTRIRPGMTADVRFTQPLTDQTLSVPQSAVGTDEQGTYCMVKTDAGFERRDIVTGATNTERIQILKGLKAGEEVRVPVQ